MATIFDKYRNPDTYANIQASGQEQPETSSGGGFNYAGMIGAFSQAIPSIMNSVSQYNATIGDNAQYLGDYYVNAKKTFNKNTGILGGLGLLTFTDDISQDLASLENDTAARISAMKTPEATSLDDAMGKLSAFRKQDFSIDNIYSNKYARGFKTALKGAELGTSITPGLGTLIGGVAGSLTGIIGAERNKNMYSMAASAASNALRDKQRHVFAALQNNVSTMNTKNMQQQKATISAYGGPLGVSLNPVNNALDYMQNEELLSYMTDDLDSRNKKSSLPMFAFGGALGGYGGNWSDGLTFIKAGGSHEKNPLGGVPMGMAEDGQPNLVEEGEVVWNHPILANGGYVFTKRHNIPKWLQDKYKLGNEPITYAAAVDKLQQAISERPNDPIEKQTLEAQLAEFMGVQEEWRQKKEANDMVKYAANGGGLSRDKDYKSKKKPYPSVSSGDFAGGGRSYPIPTKADAIDALRLAGLHGRSDVKAKVYKKYPELRKALGGHLFWPGGPTNPPTYDFQDAMWNDMPLFNDNSGIPFNKVVDNTGTSLLSSMYDADNNEYIAPEYKNKTKVPWNYLDRTTTGLYANPDFDITLAPLFGYQYPLSSPRAKMIQNLGKTGNTNAAQNYWVEQNPTLTDDYKIDLKKNPNSVTIKDADKYNRDQLPTSGWQTGLRYMPILGAGLGLAHSLFNKPDYEYANSLMDLADTYASQVGHNRVTPKFLGDRLTYNPFDRLFYANELGAQQAATNAAIRNQSNGNRGQAIASLLASGYNGNIGLGKLFREGEEYNLAQRQKVAEFNRGTNQYNSEADLKAQMFNNESKDKTFTKVLEAKKEALKMKQAIDQARNATIMANATNLFQGLGDVGYEAEQRYWLNALINGDVFGTPNESMFDIAYGRRRRANGGKLNKRKKGVTI